MSDVTSPRYHLRVYWVDEVQGCTYLRIGPWLQLYNIQSPSSLLTPNIDRVGLWPRNSLGEICKG